MGDASAGGEGERDDGDDDAVEEDVGEDGGADGEEDEPRRGSVFEQGRWGGGVCFAPAEDISCVGGHDGVMLTFYCCGMSVRECR